MLLAADDGGIDAVITLTGVQLAAVIGGIIGAAITAGGFVLKFRKVAAKFLRLMEHFADDWSGVADRDGVKGRPGMMLRVSRLEDGQAAMAVQIGEIMDVVRGGVVLLPSSGPNGEHERTGVGA